MVYRRVAVFIALAVVGNRIGLVESVENPVAADVVVSHQGQGASRDSQFLAEEDKAAGGKAAVVSALDRKSVV